ncbi:rRNA (cytosine-C5)-methyltransferase [Atopobacter sp. AH10]|uniref:RsmB/NOP family class I SAM-dependent RNA methyltransferase n=1 Tax=Atopobacter sp. AH10 TaxID=2315861 RepID=UPI000EF178EF|nr:RsmF rRNA methyltransferase first C-terminal domain-containing protein [Atopobacter sp. AH10]RLK63361.1 rRNA (cytosine-C5)-methyltransferase [Atopobacter sp. AH10]
MQLPKAFIEKYQTLLAEEAEAFFQSLEKGKGEKAFRLNPIKAKLAPELTSDLIGNCLKAPFGHQAYFGEVKGKSPEHVAGLVYSQEPSAMIVADVAEAKAGERILDLCAAPGGKTTQLAADMAGEGLLVSNEIIPKRAKILAENVERWGYPHVVVTNHSPAELVAHFPEFFDAVVVDAPCSGEGMFRKDNPASDLWEESTPIICQRRQKDILLEAVKMLKVGGRLIYSTCTFAKEEDEEIVSWLVEELGLSIEAIDRQGCSHGRKEWGSVPGLEGTVRLWPHLQKGEGHFVAKLVKGKASEIFYQDKSDMPKKNKKKRQKSQKTPRQFSKEEQVYLEDLLARFPFEKTGKLVRFGDRVYYQAEDFPDSQGLKLPLPGLAIGEFRKNRIEPLHAFALLADPCVEKWPRIDLTEEEWRLYMSGQSLPYKGQSSWVLLTYRHLPFAFAKHTAGQLKNAYPKGLRFV